MSTTPAPSFNRVIGKISPGGQTIAVVHGSSRFAGSTARGAAALGVADKFGGGGGNATGIVGTSSRGGTPR